MILGPLRPCWSSSSESTGLGCRPLAAAVSCVGVAPGQGCRLDVFASRASEPLLTGCGSGAAQCCAVVGDEWCHGRTLRRLLYSYDYGSK